MNPRRRRRNRQRRLDRAAVLNGRGMSPLRYMLASWARGAHIVLRFADARLAAVRFVTAPHVRLGERSW